MDERFTPVFMRNATAYGASPRQRFDLVLNNLAGFAHTIREIRMTSDGSPWRPITHIEDICAAMLCALEAPREAVAGEAFNVGADLQNYRIREIAEIVAKTFPGCALTVGDLGGDTRSYRVSFAKIRARMPAFQTRWTAEGAASYWLVLQRIGLTPRQTIEEPALYAAQGAALPAGHRPDRRAALLAPPCAGLGDGRRFRLGNPYAHGVGGGCRSGAARTRGVRRSHEPDPSPPTAPPPSACRSL